jgi:hypothetical protein
VIYPSSLPQLYNLLETYNLDIQKISFNLMATRTAISSSKEEAEGSVEIFKGSCSCEHCPERYFSPMEHELLI